MNARAGPPGLSVLIQRRGLTEFHRRGYANVRTRQRSTPTDHMRIASVAKAYSGAVTLALVADGRLSVEDTIASGCPGGCRWRTR